MRPDARFPHQDQPERLVAKGSQMTITNPRTDEKGMRHPLSVSKPAIFYDTLFCFSRVAEHHFHKHAISSWRISKGQAVDGKPETNGRDYED
jgi:hypothetical protein